MDYISENEHDDIMIIGRSATDNWKILSEASQNDTIFHLDGFPSPYVIVKKPANELEKGEIIAAAIACKSKSKYKSIKKVSVLWTPVGNVTKGKVTGEFIIKSNKQVKLIVI